jgi:DnaK suppressor protein
MARKKKGSGKPRKKSAGKAGARTKRASGSKATRTGSRRKSAAGAAKKKAARKAAKKAPRRKAPAKAARKKAAAKRAPARKKAAKKKAPARKPARKASAPAKPAAKPARKAPARKPRAPGRDAAFFDHFRRKLLEQRENITRRLDDLRGELRGLEETPRELEEWAQEEKDRDILIRLEDRETDELRKIQAALQLIDQREYGLCQICGKPIPRARLEELPTAFRCVDCTP